MAGWALVAVVVVLALAGGGALLGRRSPDPAVQERFDRYCRMQ